MACNAVWARLSKKIICLPGSIADIGPMIVINKLINEILFLLSIVHMYRACW